MKILYFSHSYLPNVSSASLVAGETVRRLMEKGHEVDVLVPQNRFDCARGSDALPIFPCPEGVFPPKGAIYVDTFLPEKLSPFSEVLALSWGGAMRCLKGGGYDLIISEFHPKNPSSFSALMVASGLGIPVCLRTHDVLFDVSPEISPTRALAHLLFTLNRKAIRGADIVFTQSREFSDFLRSYYGRRGAIDLFPNGVDTDKFGCGGPDRALAGKMGLEGSRVLLYSGNVSLVYGLDVMIRALPGIVAEEPETVLVMLGSGPGYRDLRALSKKVGVDDRVIWHPPVSYDLVPAYLSIADVCIGTLRSSHLTVGTVPTKVLQYMSCGKVVACSHNGVSRELLIDGFNGVTAEGGPKEIAGEIVGVLSDEGRALSLGRNARRYVEERYDWRVLIDKFDERIQECASQKHCRQ